jgi:hypothetical protein
MTPAQKRTSTKPKATKKPGQKLNATSKEMLLSIIVQMSALHGGKAPVELVARTGGYGNAKTPAFKMALKRAATRGHLVVHPDGTVAATDSGHGEAQLSGMVLPTSNREAHEKIMNEHLTPKMKEAFELMIDGQPFVRSDIAKSLGYVSAKEAAFQMLLRRIRDKGFLEFLDKESVQLSDVCFPVGRPTPPFQV